MSAFHMVPTFVSEVGDRAIADELSRWGFCVAGRAERKHHVEPRLAYRLLWLDVPLACRTGG